MGGMADDRLSESPGSDFGPRGAAGSRDSFGALTSASYDLPVVPDGAKSSARGPVIDDITADGAPAVSPAPTANKGSFLSHGHGDRPTDLAQQSAASRVAAANARDAVADARDLAARARDRAAELRDRELGARSAAAADDDRATTGAEILLRAARYRSAAAIDRAAAARIIASSAADRDQAAHDREQAARDRRQAAMDREALLEQLQRAATTYMNGRPARSSGLVDIDHAIDRARRATGRLVVAYVGVVEATVIDAEGDSGREARPERVLGAIRRHLRGSDLIVRLAGDELLCLMFGATAQNAGERFASVRAELESLPDPCEITVGLAALSPGDSLDALIKSAGAALPLDPGHDENLG
jgi:GGDEF domain-containing protein